MIHSDIWVNDSAYFIWFSIGAIIMYILKTLAEKQRKNTL